MFSLLNVFEKIMIIILDSFNLILNSVKIVFSIEINRFHEIYRHFSFVVVINSIVIKITIIK